MHEGEISPEGQGAGFVLDHEPSLALGSLVQRFLVRRKVDLGVGVKEQIALNQVVLEVVKHNVLGLIVADFFLTLFDFKVNWLCKEGMFD